MSQKEPTQVYVTQPDPVSKKTDRIYAIGGLPSRFTRDEAEAVVEAINDICWMSTYCAECGHKMRFEASACSACGKPIRAPWLR